MDINSLLNPVEQEPELSGDSEDWSSAVTKVMISQPTTTIQTLKDIPRSTPALASTRAKASKMPKDAPNFRKGATRGEVKFPPYDAGDNAELAAEHQRLQIYPSGVAGSIVDFRHRIPYSSDKKTFLAKTGREAFEVFQYTFKIPGDDKEYTVMWDYNIGLVRITPFFKSCKYSKTTPARALGLNSGLREITHSITGGALAAQGYWMPFKAAKALVANFAWSIREALTPIFGEGFLSLCLQPGDPTFGNFKIDQAIIQACTQEQQSWLQRSDAYHASVPGTPAGSDMDADLSASASASEVGSPMLMPKLQSSFTPYGHLKHLQPMKITTYKLMSAGHEIKIRSAAGSESGYGTDTEHDYSNSEVDRLFSKPIYSPQVSPRTLVTPAQWAAVSQDGRVYTPDERDAVEALMSLRTYAPAMPANIPQQNYPQTAAPMPMESVKAFQAMEINDHLTSMPPPAMVKRKFAEFKDESGNYNPDVATRAAPKAPVGDHGPISQHPAKQGKELKNPESTAANWLMELSKEGGGSTERPVKRSRRASM